MCISTNTPLPSPYGPNRIAETRLPIVPRWSFGISITPSYMFVSPMLPSIAVHTATELWKRPGAGDAISFLLLRSQKVSRRDGLLEVWEFERLSTV